MAAILGGEKRDDLLKDDVREIADAVHRRFYRFLRSGWGGGLTASPRATRCGIYNRHRRWREPHLLGAGASQLHFPCGRRAELTGLSRVARDEPSGSASGEEGGLGFSVGVEEEEQVFSIRVRKKVSGVFWTSEEDWGAGELDGEMEAGERVVRVYCPLH